ncbi:MAG: hypothetical protein CMJ76_01205 [Planctomycetaceae bacterium]|nr:hypothetical protein [Planctomycetaceae bacterium]|tara:strand:+ start:2936 stop:3937 length:1002 start_codon:yes stop_codon:yes gene_type:complete
MIQRDTTLPASFKRTWLARFAVCTLLLSGCPWQSYLQKHSGLPPVAFQGKPTLEQLMSAVNTTQLVKQLQSQGARLSVAGAPTLKAQMIVDQPRKFRLTAGLFDFTATELDFGSNDQLAWLWVKQQPEPAVYYVRHDQLATTAARNFLPIDLNWITEAVGLVYLDPAGHHEGPFELENGRYEIRSRLQSPSGEVMRRMIVDDRFGWVLEQHLTLANGQILASVKTSQHSFYPRHGVSLPHRVQMQLFPGTENQMAFQIDVPKYQINNNVGDASQIWSLPEYDGYPQIDLSKVTPPEVGRYAPPTLQQQIPPTGLHSNQTRIASPRYSRDLLNR